MTISPIEKLIQLLAQIPGLGPRSARRAALHLIRRKESLLAPLALAFADAAASIKLCGICGNIDVRDPCGICSDPRRDQTTICVVEQVSDLWALERTGAFKGCYHVLGGVLSALDGVGPETLRIPDLAARAREAKITEIILATSATVEGQTTAHYVSEALADSGIAVTGLAHGVPLGGELDYLDDGTLMTALRGRRRF